MGENEHRTALVHGRKAGVLLRGTALLKWIYERVTAVSVGGVRLVAEYQPVWMTDEVGLESRRRDLESQLSMCRNERLLIGTRMCGGGVRGTECVVILEWEE